MGSERRQTPAELLRQLALSLERLAGQGFASGAVRGAAQELQAGLPEMNGELRGLLEDLLTLTRRLVHGLAERTEQPPGAFSDATARAVVHGALEEFRQSAPALNETTSEVLRRVNLWLERSAEAASRRAEESQVPGFRARAMAEGAIEGAVTKLQESREVLAPMAQDLATRVGQGFVDGIESRLREEHGDVTERLEDATRKLIHAAVDQLEIELTHRRHSRNDSTTGEPPLRRASREISSGIFAALGESLRGPLVLAAGAGSALVFTAFLVTRLR